MDHLPFQNEELDLIWSEGAIYNIGFERGMNEWNRFLKKNGFIAVTEVSWFTPERPAEIEHPDRPFHSTGEVLDGTLLCPTSFASRGIFEGTPRE